MSPQAQGLMQMSAGSALGLTCYVVFCMRVGSCEERLQSGYAKCGVEEYVMADHDVG